MPNFFLAAEPRDLVEYLLGPDKTWKNAGLDTEFTSLNSRLARLAGFSVCRDHQTAMYVPVGHTVGNNLFLEQVMPIFIEAFKEKKALVWFAPADLNTIQANTGWYPKNFLDVMELVYLNDPDRKVKRLKTVVKEELGVDMAQFESLFTQEEIDAEYLNISTKLPERCFQYACADAFYTRGIWALPKYQQVLTDHPFPVRLDTEVADVMRKVEHNGGMELNEPYIYEQLGKMASLEEVLKEQIHRMIGRPFEIDSPKQLGIALFETLAIPNVGMTSAKKNPMYKTGADELEELAKQYHVVDSVLAYRKVKKARTTYLEKLKKLAERKIPIRFNFYIYGAPTFRFSAPGGDPDEDGATGINIQAVSNGLVEEKWGVDLSPVNKGTNTKAYEVGLEELLVHGDEEKAVEKAMDVLLGFDPEGFKNKPWVIKTELGTPVCIRETCVGCNAGCKEMGYDVTRRSIPGVAVVPSIRQAFKAPAGYTLLSFDYVRQELVIGANLSGDPVWLEALKNDINIHEQTAADCFLMTLEQFQELKKTHPLEYDIKYRIGKVINFAIFYGAKAWTIAKQAGISEDVAEQMLKNFERKHQVLYDWIDRVQAFARKNGYTTTYWGRKRWLKKFYDEGSYAMKAFADRSAVNTCIQGTGAEVTRMGLVRVDKNFQKSGIKKIEAALVMQQHDDLTYCVRDDMVEKVIPIIAEGMRIHVKEWEAQLDVDGKRGIVWGDQKKFKIPKPVKEAM